MAANRFDQAAEMPIINTYVPIDFNNLYRIGATQKAAVDQAIADIGNAVQTFGEFKSPSRIDTENYYNMTLGQMQDLINEASTNPDMMKDAGFRAKFYNRLNSLDYAGLSQLKESADNLRAGLEMRAKMEAAGTYRNSPYWDSANIEGYDTLSNRAVFTDITPTKWMSANELSNPYFDNLQPSSLGSVWQNGVKYNRSGITYDTLYGIADARFNDLVSTPQGQAYYNEILDRVGGDASAARQAFVGMIADSQRDRIRNVDTVDPAWLASLRASNSRNGTTDVQQTMPTRLDLINEGINTKINQLFRNNVGRYYNSKQQQELDQELAGLNQAYQIAVAAYNQNPNDSTLLSMVQAGNLYNQARYGIIADVNRRDMLDTFQNTTNFSAEKGESDPQYTRENYRHGVQAALDRISTDLSLNAEDRLFTGSGGTYALQDDGSGVIRGTYGYANSSGFLMPETIFSAMTGVEPRKANREDWSVFGNTDLNFRTLFENGSLNSVQFNPDNKVVRVANGQLAVPGTVRIPVEEVESKVGTGTLNYQPGLLYAGFLPTNNLFGTETTERALKQLYGAQKVERKVGNDNVEYFEFKAYKVLPPENGTAPESITAIDQSWFNSSTYGGIGTSTLTNDNYYNSSSRALNIQ